ncbi:MAG: T9SS type A sorting domain-containing protein [Bacteroidetes bacterium]|nr:T9SS type A sorting domain-containing protein [Bacteroidota bacterium]
MNSKYKYPFFKIAFLAIGVLFAFSVRSQILIVPPNPGNLSTVEHLTQSNDYTVEVKKSSDVNYTTCFVYKTNNYATEAIKSETSVSFTNVSFSGTSINVRITCKFTANNVTIRPLDYGVNAVRSGNVITFTLSSPRKISIEVNDRKNPLFIFADTPDVPNTKATYYYAPGTVTNIGLQKQLKSGESVYIAGGAVVEGSFKFDWNSNNISVKGRGILCMGEWLWESKDLAFLGPKAMFSTATNRLQMEGIILANSTGWQISIYNSDGNKCYDNQFRNLKLISWNPNSDGIWVNGNNIVVDDCFIFNNDDACMSHAVSNSKISNMVIWGGLWGRIYMHSGQDTKPLSDNMTLENINVIGKDGGSELILVSGGSSFTQNINNFTFRNIRIEAHPNTSSYNTNKFLIMNISGSKQINNWLFENVTLDYKNPDEGEIYGTSSALINKITLCNFKIAGSYVTTLAQANMDKNSYATNVTFCTSTGIDGIDSNVAELTIYPNPSTDFINVKGTKNNSQIALYDMLGKKVLVQDVNSDDAKIDVSGLKSGMYFFTIIGGGKIVHNGKLIKE